MWEVEFRHAFHVIWRSHVLQIDRNRLRIPRAVRHFSSGKGEHHSDGDQQRGNRDDCQYGSGGDSSQPRPSAPLPNSESG